MKKLILLFTLFATHITLIAQNVNLNEIKKNLEKKSSDYNQEKLLVKFKGLPIQLDSIESRHLYYGNKASVDYKKADELRKTFKEENYQKSIELAEEILKNTPTDLETISIIMEAYYKIQGNSTKLNHYSAQFTKIIDAILSSGDGKTEKTAFLTNSVTDEYILLAILKKNASLMKRISKPSKNGMYDIWDENGKKIYINVIYDMKF